MDPAGSYAWQAAAAKARPFRLRPRMQVHAVARALLLWGLAAAALSLAVMLTLLMGHPRAPPADAEAADDLLDEAALLLLCAAGQALAAQVALLVPWRPLTWVAWMVGARTSYHARAVLRGIAVACGPGHRLQGAVAVYFWILVAFVCVALLVTSPVVLLIFGDDDE